MGMIDMPNDYFLVQFTPEEDYRHALYEGPWMIADHCILVQRWRPLFTITATQTRKVATWIRIPGLPIKLYNDRFLWRVGNKLGSMLKIDKLTSIHSRGKFARICAEINLNKKLVSMINVMGHIIKLEYEGLHAICFKCGKYGHRQEVCVNPITQSPTLNGDNDTINKGAMDLDDDDQHAELQPIQPRATHTTVGDATQIAEENNTVPDSEALYGPWMMVKRKRKSGKNTFILILKNDIVHPRYSRSATESHLKQPNFESPLPRQQEDNNPRPFVSNVDNAMQAKQQSVTNISSQDKITSSKIRNPKAGRNPQQARKSMTTPYGPPSKPKDRLHNSQQTRDAEINSIVINTPNSEHATIANAHASSTSNVIMTQQENTRRVLEGIHSVTSNFKPESFANQFMTRITVPEAEVQAYAKLMRQHLDPSSTSSSSDAAMQGRVIEINAGMSGALQPTNPNDSLRIA
ncbi:uncharacterized protein LOC109796515 [Cajanus cajan]|uniref:uncharacterized protein LOC109796515 n=1 Tax=Cajanus cajan TaxID=3821 RepID=UPI00098DCA70|nr:uncharacterized protein LOC109796515 [Cajanus cajan]